MRSICNILHIQGEKILMTDIEKSIEKALIASKPMNCELCGEKVYYLDGGQYQCRNCEHIMLDDFGKVKA